MKRKLVKLPPVYEKIEERVTACTQPEGLTVTLSGDVAMIGYSKVSEYSCQMAGRGKDCGALR